MPLNLNTVNKEAKKGKIKSMGNISHCLVDDYVFPCNCWVTKDGVVTGELYDGFMDPFGLMSDTDYSSNEEKQDVIRQWAEATFRSFYELFLLAIIRKFDIQEEDYTNGTFTCFAKGSTVLLSVDILSDCDNEMNDCCHFMKSVVCDLNTRGLGDWDFVCFTDKTNDSTTRYYVGPIMNGFGNLPGAVEIDGIYADEDDKYNKYTHGRNELFKYVNDEFVSFIANNAVKYGMDYLLTMNRQV